MMPPLSPSTFSPDNPCLRILQCMAVTLLTACAGAEPTASMPPRVIEAGAVYAGEGTQFTQLRGLDSLGIKAILDLDREHAYRVTGTVTRDWQIARDHGIRFVHLPLHPTEPPSVDELNWAVRILTDRSTQPILVHADGSDERTRMVIAAYRIRVQRWPPELARGELMAGSADDARLKAWEKRLFEYARSPSDGSFLRSPSDGSKLAAIR